MPELLCIRQEKHLARALGFQVSELRNLADNIELYCDELELHDPAKPDKVRIVLDVQRPLRTVQERILDRVLLPKLMPSDFNFGGVRGRHIKLNAEQHLHSQFVFTCDIAGFYPSVHSSRVYRLFTSQECSPDVSRLLTRLCSFRYHLALGLITSPFLADQILKPIDRRIAKMASDAGLIYSRYVDDLTLSGPFDLQSSGYPTTIKKILTANGFWLNEAKDLFGKLGDANALITQVRINRGRIDASRRYIDELCADLIALRALGNGREFSRRYYTSGQMWGRIEFVAWLRPGRRSELRRLYASVPWSKVEEIAGQRGLVACRKTLRPKRLVPSYLCDTVDAQITASPSTVAAHDRVGRKENLCAPRETPAHSSKK